jgi:DNA modification methylase
VEEYVARLVGVFGEVKRLLADHGVLWVVLGDSYVAKQLQGTPWRVALALQADGWFLRSDCIWSKPDGMPSSVSDRPTTVHEYVFMLTKRSSYYFDAHAVREPYVTPRGFFPPLPDRTLGEDLPPAPPRAPDGRLKTAVKGGVNSAQPRDGERWPTGGRNLRTVWEITAENYAGAHFAVYPTELVRRAVLSSCPEWVCRECGQPRTRIVGPGELAGEAKIQEGPRPAADERHTSPTSMARTNGRTWRSKRELGWTDCGHGSYRAGVVLDPFHGTGTTSLVARNHKRYAVGVELNEDYCRMASERLRQLSLLAT